MYIGVCVCVGNKTQVGVAVGEDSLKVLDDLPSSAVEMQVKSKVSMPVRHTTLHETRASCPLF